MSLIVESVIEIPSSTGLTFDHGAFDPNSRRVFAAHTGCNSVEVIDHGSHRHVATLHNFPESAGVVADEGQVLVTNRGAASLAWIDGDTLETRAVLNTGHRPNGVAIVSHLRLAVVACIGDETQGAKLQALSLDEDQSSSIDLPGRPRWCVPDAFAGSSAFALKGHGGDVRRIGHDLGVNYIVQGSIRRIGARVRITAQLVETKSGQQIWAEQYDRELQNIFEVQDEITATVAARIEPEIGIAERALTERKSPQAFDAWDFFRLGTKHFYKSTASDNLEAQRLFRRAIDIDPSLAEAYGFLSYSIVLSMVYFDVEPDDALLNEAVAIAKTGATLDERDALIRFMYGRALLGRGAWGVGDRRRAQSESCRCLLWSRRLAGLRRPHR